MAPLFPWTVWATKLVIEVVAHYSLRLAILGLVLRQPELLRHNLGSLLVSECIPHSLRHVDHSPAHVEELLTHRLETRTWHASVPVCRVTSENSNIHVEVTKDRFHVYRIDCWALQTMTLGLCCLHCVS